MKFVFCVWYKTGSCLAGSQLDGQLCRMRSLSSSPFSCGAEIPSLMNTKVILKWALFGDFFFFFLEMSTFKLSNLKRRTVLPPPSATSKGGQGVWLVTLRRRSEVRHGVTFLNRPRFSLCRPSSCCWPTSQAVLRPARHQFGWGVAHRWMSDSQVQENHNLASLQCVPTGTSGLHRQETDVGSAHPTHPKWHLHHSNGSGHRPTKMTKTPGPRASLVNSLKCLKNRECKSFTVCTRKQMKLFSTHSTISLLSWSPNQTDILRKL